MTSKFLGMVLGLAVFASSGFPALADDMTTKLLTGTEIKAQVGTAGESRFFDIEAGEGDYLRGVLNVSEGQIDLDLVDASGEHLRQLKHGESGQSDFHFVAEQAGIRLKVTARSERARFALQINWHVSPDQQRTADATFLSPRMEQLASMIAAGEGTDDFWKEMEQQGAPLVEARDNGSYVATFLWRGAQKNVRLFGAPSGNHENLDRLQTSDVWYKSFIVPSDTRISYQLAPDVPDVPGNARERRVAILSTAQQDPLNPLFEPADGADRFNRDSVLELPDAPKEPYLGEQGHPEGTLQTFQLASERLGNTRAISIYRPANFDAANPDTKLIFLFDGKEMVSKLHVPNLLDNMIGTGAIAPTVAVLVSNPGNEARARELPANPDFADFMAQELLPKVLAETGLKVDAAHTALGGASYGGLASTTIALRYPDLFGNVLSMSGSYWWSPPGTPANQREYVAYKIALEPVPPVRFFLSAGLFEGDTTRGVGSILNTNRHLRDLLLAKKSHVFYREYAGGHDWLIWRAILVDGLRALFGEELKQE